VDRARLADGTRPSSAQVGSEKKQLRERPVGQSRGEPVLSDAVERIVRAHDLLRRGRARFAILSAGPEQPRTEAAELAALLERWGIARERLILEEHSANTRDNAVESVRIRAGASFSQLLVVTSALHMPRSWAAFARRGCPSTPRHGLALGAGLPLPGPLAAPARDAIQITEYVLREARRADWCYRAVGYAR